MISLMTNKELQTQLFLDNCQNTPVLEEKVKAKSCRELQCKVLISVKKTKR